MRFIFLLTIVLVSSCENEKVTIVNRQQAIKNEMEHVKGLYYKKSDSLESLKEADTYVIKQLHIAEALSSADRKRIGTLVKLQREYDSLELALKKEQGCVEPCIRPRVNLTTCTATMEIIYWFFGVNSSRYLLTNHATDAND